MKKEGNRMALEDKDIFYAIFEKYSDQPIEFIMEQYEKAKLLNMAIKRRLNTQTEQPVEAAPVAQPVVEEKPVVEAKKAAPAPRKVYTRADFVCAPEDAITDTTIACCLCGKTACSLTSRHLALHDLSVEEYKELCGYAPNQKLMSRNFEAKMLRNVQMAQQARKEKRQAENA